MFIYFTPIVFEAFQEESWIKMGVMILFALTGLFEAIRTVLKKKTSN
jgi:ABC-type microcin C transport system permease subunit YejE